MHKQSSKGSNYCKEILRTTFFLIKDRLIFFYLNTRFLDSKPGIFCFTFPKKLGRLGEGKRNILLGRPYYRYNEISMSPN